MDWNLEPDAGQYKKFLNLDGPCEFANRELVKCSFDGINSEKNVLLHDQITKK